MDIHAYQSSIEEEKIQMNLIYGHLNGVNSTHSYLINLTSEKFIDLIEKNSIFPTFQQWMNYYLWLFREEAEFQQIINHHLFPTKYLVQFIYYSLGKWIKAENDPDEFFMEIASLFNSEKCLQILLEEKVVDIDVNLALALISNLDEDGIQYYFYKTGNLENTTNFFYNLFGELEESMIKSFFIRNPELYANILQMFKSKREKSELDKKKYDSFMNKFKIDLEMIDLILYIKIRVFEKYDIEKEKLLPCNQRNLSRLVGIVNALKGNTNANDIIQILYRQRVIIDREEKELIRSLLHDTYIQSIFKLSETIKL